MHSLISLSYSTRSISCFTNPGEDLKGVKEPPSGGWENYLKNHAISLMEFTVGHKADLSKGTSTQQKGDAGSAKDVPKNKLMNFHAMRSYGFRFAHGNYFTVLGESTLAPPTQRTLDTTEGFKYRCLSEECGDDIGQLVLNHPDVPVPWTKNRSWHERLIDMVVSAAKSFREKI